jgi:hypothetical protein
MGRLKLLRNPSLEKFRDAFPLRLKIMLKKKGFQRDGIVGLLPMKLFQAKFIFWPAKIQGDSHEIFRVGTQVRRSGVS